ncbi:FimV/HubP family polar landmark protein [uncultured Marinobacter sp.]|uniref:FimV/HubP family polar landmark protein n=1 Tax=uncultured Marinobacter sp. TaxID=187379 RepID=UPI0030D93F2E
MKVRKLAVALALAGGLGSGVAQALGLGEIELQSYLNQPLDAEIDLRRTDGINPNEIFVNLASERDYQRVGLTRDYFLTRLQFDVTTSPRGELVITVSSREPVREPYLNFLVEVTWPSGRVMREYAALVDPPVFADESAPRQQAQAPASRAPAPAQRTPQPTQQPARSTAPRAATGQQGGTYSTGASDTLWGIAQSVRPESGLSVQQVMLALQDLNPDAFVDGNINRLRRGQVLRIPDADQVRQRTQAEAVREVAAQNQAFADRPAAVDATDRTAADSGQAAAPQTTDSAELRLVAAPDQQDSREDGSAGGDGRQDGRADAGQAVTAEEIDRVRRENDELSSRMEDLQDQVETLQRLIELKDNQLSEMQRTAGQESDAGMPADGTATDETDDESAYRPGAMTDQLSDDMDEGDEGLAPLPGAGDPDSGSGDRGPEGAPDDTFMPSEGRDAAAMDDGAAPAGEATADPVAASGQPQERQPQPVTPAQPEQGFAAKMIDLIAGNPIYQVALGGFLVLLLLLGLLISRRRAAARENEFYRQLEEEDESGAGGFDLNLGEEEGLGGEPLEEADRYVSYGQHDAAAEVLETAISREPSRSDLRLKLLAVYAASGNRPSFDKQYAELEAMEMDEVMPEAQNLRDRLEDVESTPSIDELESQLRSDSYGSRQQPERSTEQLSDEFEGTFGADTGASVSADDSDDLMSSFDELELPEDDHLASGQDEVRDDADRPIDFDLSEMESDVDEPVADAGKPSVSDETDDFSIEFDMPEETADDASGGELGGEFDELDNLAPQADSPADDNDFGSLELDDLEEPATETGEGELPDLDAEMAGLEQSLEGDDTDLDESFLDELDAELDKAASDDEGDLSELELDVSDEDLALMDDVAEPEDADKDDLSLDDLELDEPFAEGELDLDDDSPVAGADDALADLDVPELDENLDDLEPASDQAESDTLTSGAAASGIDDIDEAELGDDDDFDFLAGTDEVATKLDLARAYVEMGDAEGAREILEEVILEGTDEQKTDAQSLLKKLP